MYYFDTTLGSYADYHLNISGGKGQKGKRKKKRRSQTYGVAESAL